MPQTNSNPLLDTALFPKFAQIKSEHAEDAVDHILAKNRVKLNTLLKTDEFSWDNLIQPLEESADELNNAFSPIRHLNSVMNNDKLRNAYNQCLPKLSEYSTEVGQNVELFEAYNKIKASAKFTQLSLAKQKTIDNALRDFKLSGVGLSSTKKQRFKEINLQLASLGAKFSENVLDVTNTWFQHISDRKKLQGLPQNVLALAAQTAKDKELSGWVLNLEFPLWHPVMQYAKDRDLRQEMYQAYVTRASTLGTHNAKYDNQQIMLDILKLKNEKATLLGFKTYAEVSLASKMAQDSDKVIAFLQDLLDKSKHQAQQEFAELTTFAKEHGVEDLQPWDIAFFSEQLKTAKFNLSSEELRDWFPADKVTKGMFLLVEKLFDIKVKQNLEIKTWHPDVQVFTIKRQDKILAHFYLDLYARPNKRGGAWMDECRSKMRLENQQLQLPIAYLTCNFSPPVADKKSLLTFEEVTTLFHEFGHGLQHMLTKIEVPGVSGINGVEWDAVELPSQFMENFCWQPSIIPFISAHFENNEPLPAEKLEALLKAKNFQSAMGMLRQIEFAIFDMRLHGAFDDTNPDFVENTLSSVRAQTAIFPIPSWNRFANSFSHIFAGGYAAGYYSYKWAEVLSSDAFSLFEENGILDKDTGTRFLNFILEAGGSEDALDLFVKFRGRKPESDALLRHSGIELDGNI